MTQQSVSLPDMSEAHKLARIVDLNTQTKFLAKCLDDAVVAHALAVSEDDEKLASEWNQKIFRMSHDLEDVQRELVFLEGGGTEAPGAQAPSVKGMEEDPMTPVTDSKLPLVSDVQLAKATDVKGVMKEMELEQVLFKPAETGGRAFFQTPPQIAEAKSHAKRAMEAMRAWKKAKSENRKMKAEELHAYIEGGGPKPTRVGWVAWLIANLLTCFGVFGQTIVKIALVIWGSPFATIMLVTLWTGAYVVAIEAYQKIQSKKNKKYEASKTTSKFIQWLKAVEIMICCIGALCGMQEAFKFMVGGRFLESFSNLVDLIFGDDGVMSLKPTDVPLTYVPGDMQMRHAKEGECADKIVQPGPVQRIYALKQLGKRAFFWVIFVGITTLIPITIMWFWTEYKQEKLDKADKIKGDELAAKRAYKRSRHGEACKCLGCHGEKCECTKCASARRIDKTVDLVEAQLPEPFIKKELLAIKPADRTPEQSKEIEAALVEREAWHDATFRILEGGKNTQVLSYAQAAAPREAAAVSECACMIPVKGNTPVDTFGIVRPVICAKHNNPTQDALNTEDPTRGARFRASFAAAQSAYDKAHPVAPAVPVSLEAEKLAKKILKKQEKEAAALVQVTAEAAAVAAKTAKKAAKKTKKETKQKAKAEADVKLPLCYTTVRGGKCKERDCKFRHTPRDGEIDAIIASKCNVTKPGCKCPRKHEPQMGDVTILKKKEAVKTGVQVSASVNTQPDTAAGKPHGGRTKDKKGDPRGYVLCLDCPVMHPVRREDVSNWRSVSDALFELALKSTMNVSPAKESSGAKQGFQRLPGVIKTDFIKYLDEIGVGHNYGDGRGEEPMDYGDAWEMYGMTYDQDRVQKGDQGHDMRLNSRQHTGGGIFRTEGATSTMAAGALQSAGLLPGQTRESMLLDHPRESTSIPYLNMCVAVSGPGNADLTEPVITRETQAASAVAVGDCLLMSRHQITVAQPVWFARVGVDGAVGEWVMKQYDEFAFPEDSTIDCALCEKPSKLGLKSITLAPRAPPARGHVTVYGFTNLVRANGKWMVESKSSQGLIVSIEHEFASISYAASTQAGCSGGAAVYSGMIIGPHILGSEHGLANGGQLCSPKLFAAMRDRLN